MDTCWDDRSKWEIYNEKIHKRAHSVHNSKVIKTCLARGNIFENVGFPKETRQNLLFIEKYATTSKFSYIYRSFGIIHVKCRVRLYLVFVFPKGQYESKYGLKSDSLKVADYVFSATFILLDFNPYLLSYQRFYLLYTGKKNNNNADI